MILRTVIWVLARKLERRITRFVLGGEIEPTSYAPFYGVPR